jgi:hypothetical protein
VHLQSTDDGAVEDDPRARALWPDRFVEAVPADRLVIRICQAGGVTRQPACALAGRGATATARPRPTSLRTTRSRTRSRRRTPWSRPRTGAARARSPAG